MNDYSLLHASCETYRDKKQIPNQKEDEDEVREMVEMKGNGSPKKGIDVWFKTGNDFPLHFVLLIPFSGRVGMKGLLFKTRSRTFQIELGRMTKVRKESLRERRENDEVIREKKSGIISTCGFSLKGLQMKDCGTWG